MRLYDYDLAIQDCINEETGEVDYERFIELTKGKKEKIEDLLLYVKDLKSDAEAIAEELRILQARKSAAEKKAEGIKNFLEKYLAGEKFKTPRVAVSYRTSKETVVDDLSKIPEQYLRFTEPTADKPAIRKMIESGEVIPGAHLEPKTSMIIK